MSVPASPEDVAPAAPVPARAQDVGGGEMQRYKQAGYWLALAEGSDDVRRDGAAGALRVMFAEQLGLTPTAVQELSFIHGRINLSAQLVRALADRSGYRVVPIERTDERCVAALIVKATGEEIGRTEYTIEDARSAGIVRDRSAWKTAPKRMLWARASKRVVDDFAPAVSLGITTPEEEQEISSYDEPVAGHTPPTPIRPVEEPEEVEAEVVPDDEPEQAKDTEPEPPSWEPDDEPEEAEQGEGPPPEEEPPPSDSGLL